jgi:hypothetical protein
MAKHHLRTEEGMNSTRITRYSSLIHLVVAGFCMAMAQVAVLAQSASAFYLNQNPAPTGTLPGVVLFSGHAGQASEAGTPTDGSAWLVGSAFGQPMTSGLFWNDSQDVPPDYTLGDIPSLTALHGWPLAFTIHSEEVGSGAVFSLQIDSATPAPLGQLLLESLGRLTYFPAPTDKMPFNILITATKNGLTEQQLVEIQPRPLLLQEEDLVRPGHVMPTEDSPEYIVRSVITNETSEVFNGSSRKTRDATVSGKVVVIENGNPNHIWQDYDSNQDLKTLTICAEQVVVRTAWNLPSTKVVINARSVRYEGSGRIDQEHVVQVVDGDFQWLTPHAVRAVVAFAKDLYLYGYRVEARAVLLDYWHKLSTLEASPYWAAVDETSQMEFGHVSSEIAELLHRLDSNLDYFAHPAGWVPNLSFEANLGLFSSEAESAVRVLYLSYWLGNVASSVQQKADGMANSRAQLAADFIGLTNELGTTQVRLADLEVAASKAETNIMRLQTALTNRVEQLRRMAEQAAANAAKKAKKNKWRKVVKQVGGVLTAFPVGQPILGSVGAGLTLASDIHKPKDLLNLDQSQLTTIAGAFKKGAFNQSVASFRSYLKPLNPAHIGESGWKQYLKDVKTQSKVISRDVKKIQDMLKEQEAADSDAQATLTQARAENPELNQRFGDAQADGLMDQIRREVDELRQFNADITDAIQQMARLTGEIQRHILAVDAMNRDVPAMNAILDHRALVHLKEMDRRAKERLRKYQYYLAKSYEYRFLEPYPGELNLNAIFDRMVAIGQAGTSGGGLLSAADFQSLKALYEDELAEVTYAVIERYQQNPPARSAPVSLVLSSNEMAALNVGEPVRINMVERYRVSVRDEDMRINDIDLTSFTMAVNGIPEPNATISLLLLHSGISKVRYGTSDFYFRHDQQSDVSPFLWEVRYDSNTEEKTPIKPSPADQSLLQYLLALRGVPTTVSNLMLFSRPGMWSDLELVRFDWPWEMPQYEITNLTINMSYDFRSKPSSLAALDVSVSDARVAPYIIVSRVDERGRQDGIGRFYRTFQKGVAITLTAPPAFGIWQFDRWVDAFGRNLPGGLGTSNVLALTLNDNWAVQARYINTDSDEDGLPDDWERRFYPNLAQGENDDTDQDGWGGLAEFLNGASPVLWDTDADGMGDGAEGEAGTDPTDPASMLQLAAPVVEAGGTIRLDWVSVGGKTYVVEMMAQLGSGSWEEVAVVTANGSLTSVRLAPTEPSQYYRLRVLSLTSLRLRPPVLEPGRAMRLEWASLPGTTYDVEMTPQLVPAEWQKVASVTSTGLVTSVRVPIDRPMGFYRARMQ